MKLQRAALWSVYFAAITVFADMYATQPILPLLSREFGISPTMAGTSISVVVAAIALGSSLFGPLSDIYGRKRVLVASSALLALATLACAFAPSFDALLVFRALQGLSVPGVSAVAIAYIGDRFPPERAGSIVGTYIACTGLGGLLGRVIAGVLASRFDWRAPFYAYAALTLLASIAMLLALERDFTLQRWEPRKLFAAYRAMATHVRNRRLLGAFCIGGLLFFAFIGIFTYLPYLLTGAPYHLSTAVVSTFYFAYLAGVFVSPISGRLSQRLAPGAIMMAGIGIAALGCAITLSHSITFIALGTVVLAVGMFTVQAVAPAYVNARAAHTKGGANSLYQTFYYAGAVLGATLPGLAWERWAWPGVIFTCMLSLALAFAATFALREPTASHASIDSIP
jgi:YNFM family putative membrane transporter